jgi:hypothetical protein
MATVRFTLPGVAIDFSHSETTQIISTMNSGASGAQVITQLLAEFGVTGTTTTTGRALVQTSVKVAANRRPYRPYRPWQSLPPSLEWTEEPFKGGIGDPAVPNRRNGRIIQDLEDRQSQAPNLRRTT